MDGTNAAGRKVSLLNDLEPPSSAPLSLPLALAHRPPPPARAHLVRLPSISPSLRSRTSSYTCSPVASPPTPQLVRSDSSDSTTMQTPSPITPDFAFDPLAPTLDSPVFSAQQGFFHPQKDVTSEYPVPQAGMALPYHATAAQQSAYLAQQPVQDLPATPSAAQNPSASANARPKKNSYPCPMAKAYNCNDYFTTSGHAARHAKKHTGKKDAFCPECNKAFTRKDNMEQHRRTHQSGRSASKAAEKDARKMKQQAKRPRPSPLQSANPTALSALSMVDPALPISPSTSFLSTGVTPSESFVDFAQRSPYPDPTAFSISGYPSASSYGGLDALAIAASGEKRKYE